MAEHEGGYKPEHGKTFHDKLSERLESFKVEQKNQLYSNFAARHGVNFEEAMKDAAPGTRPIDAIMRKIKSNLEDELLDETFGKGSK